MIDCFDLAVNPCIKGIASETTSSQVIKKSSSMQVEGEALRVDFLLRCIECGCDIFDPVERRLFQR